MRFSMNAASRDPCIFEYGLLGPVNKKSQGKTIIKVPWQLVFIIYIVGQYAQGVYIGYYKEGYWWSRNSNIHFLSTDHDIEANKDGSEERKIKNENGYAPRIGAHEIRVLILYPGEKGSPIKCGLQHPSLQAKPKFEALSYVWGDPTVTKDISCDGNPRNVGQNLYNALDWLRRQDAGRVLWVDALCIDQTDNRKTTQQVRIMGQIYSRVNRMLIWLGNSRGVVTPLKSVFTNPLYVRAQDLLIRLGFHDTSDMGIAMLQEHQTSAKVDWDPLMPVVKSPWFTRIWCIQELVLAKKPSIITGDSMVPWDDFADRVNERRGWFELQQIDHDDEKHPPMRNFYILHDMRQKHKNKRGNKHTLLELLFLTRGFQATDPRNKLFALVGLAGDILASNWK
ncbi:putative Heterokaryon incompatibility domain-containing protein [Seiridium cardinale]|uniref:Heterokaryon incompatibility domain-containing protein n=1 Tax=Seiridium cardinale TaxID=138064 RepID=A0ABR2Y0X3_9PEZI